MAQDQSALVQQNLLDLWTQLKHLYMMQSKQSLPLSQVMKSLLMPANNPHHLSSLDFSQRMTQLSEILPDYFQIKTIENKRIVKCLYQKLGQDAGDAFVKREIQKGVSNILSATKKQQ